MAAAAEEQEYSKGELRRQLYASLRSTGVLDSMKGQLRARLLEHLRRHKEGLLETKQRKPSVIERLLSSLFLEYLNCNGFAFTVSVFVPESQMSSWPPLSHQEMLALLHLNSASELGGDQGACLAYQLVQQMANRSSSSSIQEVSTQTSPGEACKRGMRASCTSPRQLERSLKEVEDAYIRKKDAQRSLQDRSLEDNLSVLHQEFDARVNAEVALQVCRIRDYEINAARMDEAARYRRQLARDREELEDMHKSRMDRIKAREESLLERMMSKEKAIEASAYEQRQRILREITSLRERESKLRQWKESQERREEKLDERETALRAKEEEVGLERKALHAQADEIAASRRKELEVQYRDLCDRLHQDQTVLAAEWEQLKEERVAMSIEQASSRSDKELIQALHRRLSVEEDQRVKHDMCIRELEEKLKQQTSSAANIPDQRLEEQLRESQAALEQERFRRQASEKEKKTLERKLQQKKVELAAARSPQGEWITEHKSLMATIYKQEAELQQKETKLQLMETEKEKLTDRHMKLLLKIDHLDTLVKKAQEEKDHLVRNFEKLQVQQTTNERELLETTTLLRKAQQALEDERLQHCALRSHINAVTPSTRNDLSNATTERPCGFQDKVERKSGLVDHKSNVAVAFGKTNEFFQENSKPEAHELWTRLLSNNAAKRASLEQDLEPNLFSASRPFPSGNGEEDRSNLNDTNGSATKLECNKSEVCISGKDPILNWNRTHVEGETSEECERELLVPSSSMPEINSPSAYLPNPENSGAPGDLVVLSNISSSAKNEDDANSTQDVETQEDVETRDAETQKGEGIWNSNKGEQEADEGSLSYKNVKHDLESLQSRDENHMGSSCGQQMDSHSESDHTPVVQLMPELKHPQIHEEIEHDEVECQTLGEDQSLARELELLYNLTNLTEEVNKVGMDAEIDGNSDPLMCKLGLTEDQDRSLSKQEDESECRASGRMSGLPEIMLEMKKDQNTPPDDDREVLTFDPREFSRVPDFDAHALEALRPSIVIRKQDESSPRSHPTLVLAIRNNQVVKVEKEAEGERSTSALLMDTKSSNTEGISMDTKSSIDPEAVVVGTKSSVGPGSLLVSTKSSVDLQASHQATDSSGEESAYNFDSFEEDEDEEEKPAHSEESCTNLGVRKQTPRNTTASSDLSVNDLQSKANRWRRNREGRSEQGSHSPEGDCFHEHK